MGHLAALTAPLRTYAGVGEVQEFGLGLLSALGYKNGGCGAVEGRRCCLWRLLSRCPPLPLRRYVQASPRSGGRA